MNKNIIDHLNFIGKDSKQIKLFLKYLSSEANKTIGAQTKGRPRLKMYKVIAGILYYLKTGCTWYCLPKIFGNHKTIFGWYRKICDKKIFGMIWKNLLHKAAYEGILDITRILQDGSLVTCASNNGLSAHNPRNKNKLTINRFLGTNQNGIPLNFRLMRGTTHDSIAFQSTLFEIVEEFKVQKGFHVHADKGFDSKANRRYVEILGGIPKIPRRAMGNLKGLKLKQKDSHRYPVERTFGWTNSYKAVKNIFIKVPIRVKEMHCLFFNIILLRWFAQHKMLNSICSSI